MPPRKRPAGTTTIPYLGTTLPPIAVMIRYFGPLADPSQEVTVDFAGHPCQINKVLAGNLHEAGLALEHAGVAGQINDVGGFRTTIGGSGAPIPFSMHQFGAAVDINEGSQNWHTMTMDPRIVSIMRQFHWWWGGNWGGVSYDGGHFQFMGGTVPAGAGGVVVAQGPGPAYPAGTVVALTALLFAAGFGVLVLAGAAAAAGGAWAVRKAAS